MPSVGLIGGIAPDSTIDYYRRLIARYRDRPEVADYPSILIDSIDLTAMLGYVAAGDRAGLAAYLLRELDRLARAGADFALLASNTPHVVFDDLAARSPVPLISIVEAAAAAARAQGFRRLGLLGTRFTMEGGFYPAVFARAGMDVVAPGPPERDYVHDTYMQELVRGVLRSDTRERYAELIAALHARDGLDAVILGGTELPLLLRDAEGLACPLLDTTAIHVEAAVARLRALAAAG